MADTKPQDKQQQQSGDTARAPQSSYDGDAPRIERPAIPDSKRPISDWASI